MLYSQSPPLTRPTKWRSMGLRAIWASTPISAWQDGAQNRLPISSYSYRFGEGQPVPRSRPSIGRRMFRTLIRFTITLLIGVGATLGWQSYGDEIREMLIAQAPAVGMLLPVPSTRPPVSTAAYGDPSRQLMPMASTLDAVRRSVEQLAAKQEQIAQNIVALRAARRRSGRLLPASSTAATPPAPTPQAASAPQPKPPQAKIDSACRLRPDRSSRVDALLLPRSLLTQFLSLGGRAGG